VGAGGTAPGAGALSKAVPVTAPVAARELLQRPVPPAGLAALIRAHYPSAARSEQVEGTGCARLLIAPNGSVTSAIADTESVAGSGFASACANAMRSTTGWGTPLDREGRPVSTWIHFTCEFGISY
jgi:hypothetical protein